MKRTSLFIAALLLCTIHSFAQNKETTKSKNFKFGKISTADFDIKLADADSAASAVAIFDVGTGTFEFSPKTGNFMYVFERHTRYKIINKGGYDYGNMELRFYRQNRGESKLDNMEAATYNLEGDKIITSKLSKDAKFSEKEDKNYTLKNLHYLM